VTDRAASQEVWERFASRLRGFIARRVRGEADADDVLQEAFSRIHAGLLALRDEERLEGWLFQVARRAVADHHRRRRTVPLPDDATPREDEPGTAAELAGWVEPMMARLPEEDREALRLTDLEGVPQTELASRLRISETGARSRVQRARKRLREALLDCCTLELDRRGNAIDYARKPDGGPCACDCGTA
jgi:RNA polymerase sigma-70 factor (ECF subfamily)